MTLNLVLRWTDPSSQRCDASAKPHGVEVSLPNRVKIELDDSYYPVDWSPQYASDNASSRLWHRSLTYLPALSEVPGGLAHTESILRDFAKFVSSKEGAIRVPSMDHALAIHIRVLHDLLERCSLGGSDFAQIGKLATELLPPLLSAAREPGVRVPNNHGVMLSVSLMLISVFRPSLVSDTDAASDAEVALDQIRTIFDSDGMSNENTASYQGLYVKLLRDLCDLAELSERHSRLAGDLSEAYERASMAYRRILLPDGQVPPLGDGGMGREIRFRPAPGKLVSCHNGLYVNSNEYSYIAITSGARSPVHKQMDDTSIMMWAFGRPVILDAGVQNYDASNREAASFRTQPGHSGLFFKKFDDRPLKYFNSGGKGGGRKVEASMVVSEGAEGDVIETRYELEGCTADRRILARSPSAVTLTDRVWSPDGAGAVSRFLVSGAFELHHQVGLLEARDGDVWLRLKFEPSASYVSSFSQVSWSLSNRTRCWVIEFPVASGGRPQVIDVEVGSEYSPPGNRA